MPSAMFCQSCGATNRFNDAQFCSNCGEVLVHFREQTSGLSDGPVASGPAGREWMRNRIFWITVAGVIVVAGVATGLGVAFSGGSSHPPLAQGRVLASDTGAPPVVPTSLSAANTNLPSSPTTPAAAPSAISVPGPLGHVFAAATPVDPVPYEGAHPNVYFLSPSQNIGCYIFIDGATRAECTIAQYNFPEPGRACPLGAIVSVEDGASLSKVTCATVPLQADPTNVLQYGESVTNGNLSCESSKAYVACVEVTTGVGFTLSRDQYLPVG